MKANRRRGAAALAAMLILCTVIILGMATYVTAVAAGAARLAHQRDTVQCVYAAESAIELVLAQANRGDMPSEPLIGACGSAFYQATVERDGARLVITADGTQPRPGRADLARRVRVECTRRDGAYVVTRWETPPPPDMSRPAGSIAAGGERR